MAKEHANQKTFVVAALIGEFSVTPWPFGRLDISDEAINVRGWSKKRTCLKSEIIDISLVRRYGTRYQLLFLDPAGKLTDFAVVLATKTTTESVVDELRRCGWPVRDRRGPLLSWRPRDSAE